MADYNRAILLGRLTRDPECRSTSGGTAVTNLSLAVNRRIKKDGEWTEQVSYFDVVTFGRVAENCGQYLEKGRPVLIEGELQQRRWEGQDGQKRSKIEVVASNVQFLGGRDDAPSSNATKPQANNDAPPPIDDDDIPF